MAISLEVGKRYILPHGLYSIPMKILVVAKENSELFGPYIVGNRYDDDGNFGAYFDINEAEEV